MVNRLTFRANQPLLLTIPAIRKLIILISSSLYHLSDHHLLPTQHQRPTMKFLLILSIAVMITGSSANDASDTTDNRQLQWNPNCATLALWHPVYTGDWSGGFCSLQITCNTPSYVSAADCCKFAYAGQSSNTCYTTAGIPIPTSAPVPGMTAAGTWYPDYPAGWEAGKCINTLPLPPHGSRPMYATQLQCCMLHACVCRTDEQLLYHKHGWVAHQSVWHSMVPQV